MTTFTTQRARALALLTGLSTACGATTGSGPTTGPGAGGRGPVTLAGSNAPMGDGVLLPEPGRPWLAESEPGSSNVVVDALRATVRGDDVTWGTDRFASPIAAAYRVGASWVFLARDGTVAGSDTFLGPLRRLGALTEHQHVQTNSRGRLVATDAQGVVLTTDGRAPLAPLRALPEGHVIDVVFTDADRGAVITDGGQLFRTLNGGAAWTRVDLGPEAAWRMAVEGRDLAVETTGGPRTVSPDGTVTARASVPAAAPVPPPPPPPPGRPTQPGRPSNPPPTTATAGPATPVQPPAPAHETSRVLAALLARYPALGRGAVTVTNAAGTRLTLRGDALTIADARTGRVVREVSLDFPDSCSSRVWGNYIAILCPDADAPLRLLTPDGIIEAGGEAELVENLTFSDDGQHVVATGRCRPESEEAESAPAPRRRALVALCALRSVGNQWQQLAFSGRRLRLLGMHGASALLTMRREDENDLGLHVLDVERGAEQRLRVVPLVAARNVTVRSATFTPEGVIVGVASVRAAPEEDEGDEDDDGSPRVARRSAGAPAPVGTRLLYGLPNAPLELRELPAGAESVGFTDARRGVAAGADVDHVWRTADGGVTWQRAPIAVSGSSKQIEFAPVSEEQPGAPTVECGREGCVVGARVWYPAAEARRANDGTIMAAREDAGGEAEDSSEGDAGSAAASFQMGRYGCTAPAGPLTSLLRVTAPTRRGSLHRQLNASGANGVMDAWGERGRIVVQFRWRGADAQGAFDGVTTASPLPVPQPERDTLPWRAPRYSFWGAARGGALLERCLDDGNNSTCQVLWATPGGGIVPIPDVTAFSANLRARVSVDGAMSTGNGGFVVLVSGQDPTTHVTIDSVAVVTPDGRMTSRRAFAFSGTRVHGLARYRGAAGYAVAKVNDPASFQFFPLDGNPNSGPVPLPTLSEGAVALCGATPSADAAEITLASPGYVPQVWVSGMGGFQPVATLEIAPNRTCLRALNSWSPLRANAAASAGVQRGVQLRVGQDGALAGFWDDGNVTQLLRCNRN